MPDAQPSEFTAKIVAAYLRRHQVPPDQLATLISTVHQALSQLGEPATEAVAERTPAVPIRRSIHRDFVVCLDCGWKGSMLRRHIGTAHGLTPDEYRARWSLPREHLLTAPAYSERRSGLAKQLGLGRAGRRASAPVADAAIPRPETAVVPEPTPKRRGRPRTRATAI